MKLIQLLEQVNLYEGAKERYMQPFVSLTPYIEELKPEMNDFIQRSISWAIKVLKKDDKIQWYLRWVKLEVLYKLLELSGRFVGNEKTPENEQAYQIIQNAYNKHLNYISSKTGISNGDVLAIAERVSSSNFIQNMDHFMSLDLPEIENYVFAWQGLREIYNDFRQIEDEWQKKAKQLIDIDRDDVETVVKFADGSEWINLNKPYCDIEAKAVGHCGNAASYSDDDTILSYRTIEKTPKGEMWKPRLTFVLNTNTGFLGEMKGRNNQKPDNKYHGVIIELLKNPIVKGIRGGGYMPQHNFKLEDLPDEVAEKLIDEKPGLAGIEYDYKKRGMTKELLDRMAAIFEEETDSTMPTYNKESKSFMHNIAKNINEFVEEYGGRTAQYALSILEGEEHLEMYNPDLDPEDLWVNLPTKITTKVGQWLATEHPDFIDEWKEENDDNYDPSDHRVVWDIIDENDIDQVKDALRFAMADGYETGTQSEIYNDFKKWLESIEISKIYTVSLRPGLSGWDEKQYLEISEADMVDIVSNHTEHIAHYGLIYKDEVDDLDQPYNGWHDYDEESAIERAAERLQEEGVDI